MSQSTITAERVSAVESPTFAILVSFSFSHMLNDMMQSLVPAIYPMLKDIVSRWISARSA